MHDCSAFLRKISVAGLLAVALDQKAMSAQKFLPAAVEITVDLS
jgi:hypothetical protein